MICRLIRTTAGLVFEVESSRIETDGNLSRIHLDNMAPAHLMVALAEVFRSDRFEKEAVPHHDPDQH